MICPDNHKHAESTTCHKNHGCRCDPCDSTQRARTTRIQKKRRRAQAYGRYQAPVPAIGTRRRIEGLQYLGWTMADIGRAYGGVSGSAIGMLLTRETVEPETHKRVMEAFAQLIRRGRGPSRVTADRAKAKGYLSPLAWNDPDTDAKPVGTVREKKRQGTLRGDELFAEIVWLAEDGAPAHQIAASVGKRLDTLEKYVRRHRRDDLLVHLKERKAA